jgi:hypothetical protein
MPSSLNSLIYRDLVHFRVLGLEPLKGTVCNAHTEISSVTSSQKVAFRRHCAGFDAVIGSLRE